MKMVKSLLLGSAAGLVAIAGAQAADLPVKAKPVQYVKICSLYGAGFYYIPGTDTCLKVGGFVRYEMLTSNGSFAQQTSGASATYTRTHNDLTTRARAILTLDARSQTEYGTLRSYVAMGEQWTSGDSQTAGSGAVAMMYRMFIQWAGFTAGRVNSFFDFWNTPQYTNLTNYITSDTGGTGMNLLAYTAQFGNGLSASLSLEDSAMRRTAIGNGDIITASLSGTSGATSTAWTTFSTPGVVNTAAGGYQMPDIVGNLRIEQAWGSAQIMGAVHELNAQYYGTSMSEANGYPSNEYGWAIGGGLTLNLPMLGAKDTATVQAAYAEGAIAYAAQGLAGTTTTGTGIAVFSGKEAAVGYGADAVYEQDSALQLTTAWSVYGGYQHHWNPNLRTSIYGGYLDVSFNDLATSIISAHLTSASGNPGTQDWNYWQIGSRTIWNPVKNLDLSLDVVYNSFQTAMGGEGIVYAPGSDKPKQTYMMTDQGIWNFMVRAQHNFYP